MPPVLVVNAGDRDRPNHHPDLTDANPTGETQMLMIALLGFGLMTAGLIASLDEAMEERRIIAQMTDEEIAALEAEQHD